ncbi:hypothetical protein [Plebeiibacterium sediminum]|uniref:Uncharacterized protein n=1 Tax=Plebeiibacterium sediminum TaxID=2992112 RepID=A0AAE3SH30_9BACT|nr:hypothetical protein [Plebeiobacterium sediminum]MCW3788926.1 hypothetical protein [Plebeiobacterium sediminum]
MNSELIVIALFGILNIFIEGLLWGMMGYVIFKSLRINDKYWILGACVSGLIYFIWDEIITGGLVRKLQLKINNESVSNFIDSDMFTLDFSDLAFSVVALIVGFKISKSIVNKMISKQIIDQSCNN